MTNKFLNNREICILVVGMLILLCIIVYGYIYMPVYKDILSIDREINIIEEEINKINSKTVETDELENSINIMEQDLSMLMSCFPVNVNYSDMLKNIHSIFENNGTIVDIFFTPTDNNKYLNVLNMSVNCVTSHEALKSILEGIGLLDYPNRIISLDVVSDKQSNTLKAAMSIEFYILSDKDDNRADDNIMLPKNY